MAEQWQIKATWGPEKLERSWPIRGEVVARKLIGDAIIEYGKHGCSITQISPFAIELTHPHKPGMNGFIRAVRS